MKGKTTLALHHKIFLGMLLGIAGGVAIKYIGADEAFISNVTAVVKPIGDIFLRMIFMMVIPLIVTALILGISDLGDLKKIGRIGLRTLIYTIVVSGISVFIGVGMVKIFRPGQGISESDRAYLTEQFKEKSKDMPSNVADISSGNIGTILTNIVPKNPIEDMSRAFDPTYKGGGLLSVMFFSLILGLALSAADPDKTEPVRKFLEGFYEMLMKAIGFGMKFAPYGVAALLFVMTANTGLSLLSVVLKYVLVVLAALAIHQFITYSLLIRFVGKMSPAFFFKGIQEVMLTAFSTSSSNATLPTAIRVTTEKLRIPRDITNFVLTIGSSATQNGTALYEGITVLFIAQVFGVELTLGQQLFVVMIAIFAGMGTAGVPGGSLPVIMMILVSIGVPGEGIALIYGVDRILDMSRTVLNVTGDITAAVCISRFETRNPKPSL
jgi:DAACS family dicarboxylate/amino acid:cation (Na+ or H+) symporter